MTTTATTSDPIISSLTVITRIQPTTRQGALQLIDQFLCSESAGCMDHEDAVALIENLRAYLWVV
jgi:hypothetical protein